MSTKIITVIVTYQATPWIKACLKSLLSSSTATGIVIIDNASTDNTLEYLEEFAEHIHLIRNTANKGFGQANNQGILWALEQNASFVFLLNQDVYVQKDTLELLRTALEKNPDFGIISALQMQKGNQELDEKMKAYIRRIYPEKFIRELTDSGAQSQIGKPFPLRFVNAASWMISRKCVLDTGLFHPVFYHYGEDNHYCSRVQFHGYKTGFLPAAQVVHDRVNKTTASGEQLRRSLNTIPLYTALDLRKPAWMALILAKRKAKSVYKKLQKSGDGDARKLYENQKLQMAKNTSRILEIRRETKKKWKTQI